MWLQRATWASPPTSPAATAAPLVAREPLPNISQHATDFYSPSSQKKNPTNETTALRGISARAVFWEKQCHYCRIVINIWQGSSSGAAWQCPTEYLCTRQLKVNGNPTKTLTAIKNGWCQVSNLCLIHFPGSNNVLLPSWKKKSQRGGWQECRAMDHTADAEAQVDVTMQVLWTRSCRVKKQNVCTC